MPQMSSYIKKLENYGELEVSIIKATKINKVLKALIKLNTIPKDEEFKFRERSMEMLTKWNKLLGNDGADPDDKKDAPATNGVHKDEKEKSEPAATSTATDTPAADISTPVEAVAESEKEPAVAAEPSVTEPAPIEPIPTEPATVEPVPADPAVIQPSFEEPPKTEPAQVPERPAPELPKEDAAITTEPAKANVTVAPESAAGAAEATEVVKAME